MKPLRTPMGMIFHALSLILMAFSGGLLLCYWLWKYHRTLQRENMCLEQDVLLVLGKKCTTSTPHEHLTNRLQLAQTLEQKHTWRMIVLSGGGKGETSEAEIMNRHFSSKTPVVLEDQSQDTIENFLFSRDFVQDRHVTILSSDYHARRILVLAPCFFRRYAVVSSQTPSVKWYTHFCEGVYAGWLELALFLTPKKHHSYLLGTQQPQDRS